MNIQIFGTKKCIDMKEKGMSNGEFTSVAHAN